MPEKLIRHRIAIRDKSLKTRQITDRKELALFLARKLVEEANEVLDNEMLDPSTFPYPEQKDARRIQELVDVSEVLWAIHELHNIDDILFEREMDTKKRIHGGFLQGVLAEMPDNRPDIKLRALVEDCLRELIWAADFATINKEAVKQLAERARVLGCLGEEN